MTFRQSCLKNMEGKVQLEQNELIKLISNDTEKSLESVRGSTFGHTDKFRSQSWFIENFVFIKDSNGKWVIKWKKFATPEEIESMNIRVDYNTDEKQKAREYVFGDLDGVEKPFIMTFAAEKGYDVQYLLNICPDSMIFNLEKSQKILDTYKENNFPTINFLGNVAEFVGNLLDKPDSKPTKSFNSFSLIRNEAREVINFIKRFDRIYYDSMSYLCEMMDTDLGYINQYKLGDYLFVTVQGKKIRNKGVFATVSRETTKGMEDPTLFLIKDKLFNYTYEGCFEYVGSGGRGKFRVLKFKLQERKMDEVISKVFITTDYSKFNFPKGSFQTDGSFYVENSAPIVVNENFEIIDGQRRFEMRKHYGKPIPYTIINDKFEVVGKTDWKKLEKIN